LLFPISLSDLQHYGFEYAIYLIHLGIYKSATLVSANNIVRKSIHKHALESRLSDLFGYAEMGREIQKTATTTTII
jgi:hypothetical protein